MSTIRPALPWEPGTDTEYTDIRYETAVAGPDTGAARVAKITINRPEVRNAFRPRTLFELMDAFEKARDDRDVGVIILTGEGPDAFCSGGDQRVRGDDGLAGIQQLAGDATLLYYMSEEAQEGKQAYVEKRKPDFAQFPKRP